jgi:calcium-dependent protein kinase
MILYNFNFNLNLEFIAATMDKSLYLKEEKLYQAFKMLDLDKSGKISKDELKSVLGKELNIKNKDDSYWDSMIKEVDKNGDGEVNLIKLNKIHKNKKKFFF